MSDEASGNDSLATRRSCGGFPPSPCIDVCELDSRDVCRGCRRTLAEIAAWSRMTASEQWQVVEAAAQRKPHCS
ncbi:MAG: DUF1289 domain-containing protein [Woeseia sp.]